jgi:hypothetical protein
MDFQINDKNSIFSIDVNNFNNVALELYFFQAKKNEVYKKYHHYLGVDPNNIQNIQQIPFLPVEFFRTQKVVCQGFDFPYEFYSSGTTSTKVSKHYVSDIELYRESLIRGFRLFFGNPSDYSIFSLIPSFQSNPHSSLGFMANELIKKSGNKYSGHYLNDFKKLNSAIYYAMKDKSRIFILGLSYALVDFFSKYQFNLPDAIIMETGGMKGRKEEITRQELHKFIAGRTNKMEIQSEYGMTELFSQAYSYGKGIFKPVPWLRVMISEQNDPFSMADPGENGLINIIDLANIHTCSFIATKDTGRMISENEFEVSGRVDNSDVRGCSLMYV